MLLIYTYDETFKVSSLWLRKILFCQMQYLSVWIKTKETAPNVNPQRIDQDFTLVFTGIPYCSHCPGNRYSHAKDSSCFNLCSYRISTRRLRCFFRHRRSGWELFRWTMEKQEIEWTIQRVKLGWWTTKTPVFVIICWGGKVWAQVLPDVEVKTLMPLINRWVETGRVVCYDTWTSCTGVVAKSDIHRFVKHHKGEYSDDKGNHINDLEWFWGYLKKRLAAKDEIRKERLPLYLAQYVWRYNHRIDSIVMQKKFIKKKLEWLYI